jgi:hypothetical protein
MTLKKKHKLVLKLIPKWKTILLMENYTHQTYFYSGKRCGGTFREKYCTASNTINPKKQSMTLRFNNDMLRKMGPYLIEHYVLHELSHKFFIELSALFERTIEFLDKNIRDSLMEKFEVLEHKQIYRLIVIFKNLGAMADPIVASPKLVPVVEDV